MYKPQVVLDRLASPVHPDRVDRSVSPAFKDSREWLVRKVGKVSPDSRVTLVYQEPLDSPDLLVKLVSQDLLDSPDLLVTQVSQALKVPLEIPEVWAHQATKVSYVLVTWFNNRIFVMRFEIEVEIDTAVVPLAYEFNSQDSTHSV